MRISNKIDVSHSFRIKAYGAFTMLCKMICGLLTLCATSAVHNSLSGGEVTNNRDIGPPAVPLDVIRLTAHQGSIESRERRITSDQVMSAIEIEMRVHQNIPKLYRRSEALEFAIPYPTSAIENPYRVAISTISPTILEQQLAALVPETLSNSDRDEYITEFTKIDFDRLANDAHYRAEFEKSRIAQISPASAKTLLGLADKVAGAVIGKVVGDAIDHARGKTTNETLLEEIMALQSTVSDLVAKSEQGDKSAKKKLDQIARTVKENQQLATKSLYANLYASYQLNEILRLEYEAKDSVATVLKRQEDTNAALKELDRKADVIEGQLRNANKKLDVIQPKVLETHAIVKKTSGQVETLIYQRWLDLPSKKKLEWMRNDRTDFLDHLEPAELSALETRLEVDATAKSVEEYLGYANQSLAVIGKLNILDGEELRTLNTAINVGVVFSQAIQGFASGNYLGAVTAIFGAIFGGGPSVEELRHKEIMDKLDKLEDWQIRTYQAVQQVRLDLQMLNRKIDQNHDRIMSRLDLLEESLGTVIEYESEQALKPYNVLRNHLTAQGFTIDWSMPTERQFVDALGDARFRKAVYDGYDALFFLAATQNSSKPYPIALTLRGRPGQDRSRNQDALRYWSELVQFAMVNDDWSRLWALQEPALTVTSIDERRRVGQFDKPTWTEEQFVELLDAKRVSEYAETVLKTAPLLYFLRPTNNDCKVQVVNLSNDSPDPSAVKDASVLYENTMHIVDLAIAQQALLQGDLVLELLVERLNDPKFREDAEQLRRLWEEFRIDAEDLNREVVAHRTDSHSGDPEDRQEHGWVALELGERQFENSERFSELKQKQSAVERSLFLKANPVLARNLLIYILRSDRLRRPESAPRLGLYSADFVLNSPEVSRLQNCLSVLAAKPRVIESKNSERVVVFPCSTVVASPKPFEMEEGTFQTTREFQTLVRVRARLAEVDASLRLFNDTPASERPRLVSALIAKFGAVEGDDVLEKRK